MGRIRQGIHRVFVLKEEGTELKGRKKLYSEVFGAVVLEREREDVRDDVHELGGARAILDMSWRSAVLEEDWAWC